MSISNLYIDAGKRLYFTWKQEEEGNITLIIRNRLTHETFLKKVFSPQSFSALPLHGFSLNDEFIPTDVPLEVILETELGRQYPDSSKLGTPAEIYYGFQSETIMEGSLLFRRRKVYTRFWINMPNYSDDLDMPEDLLYAFLVNTSNSSDKIKIHFPRLQRGDNYFWVNQFPAGYQLDLDWLHLTDDPDAQAITKSLKLVRVP